MNMKKILLLIGEIFAAIVAVALAVAFVSGPVIA